MNGRELIDTSNESPLLTDDHGGLENSKKFKKYGFWPKKRENFRFFGIFGFSPSSPERFFFYLLDNTTSERTKK